MQALRLVMLLAALPVCYLLFFRSQPGEDPASARSSVPEAHSEYKRDMDKARAAAGQMQSRKAEADAIP